MARIEGPGAGGRQKAHPWIIYSSSPKPPRKSKGHRAKKGRAHKAHKAKTTRTTRSASNAFHEQAGAGSIGGTSGGAHAGALPFAGAGSTAGASPRGLLELSGLDTATSEGLGGALLDLVGEGKLTVAHALAAWTHEQDRLANRAWRRPGGMVRMGGL